MKISKISEEQIELKYYDNNEIKKQCKKIGKLYSNKEIEDMIEKGQNVVKSIEYDQLTLGKSILQQQQNIDLSMSGLSASCSEKIGNSEVTLINSEMMSPLLKDIYNFQLICPISCNNIRIGVVGCTAQSDFNLASLKDTGMVLQKFKTTSSRIIDVQVNFPKKQVTFSLNNNLLKNKTLAILIQDSFLVVRIKDQGNLILLNPFLSSNNHLKLRHLQAQLKEKEIKKNKQDNVQQQQQQQQHFLFNLLKDQDQINKDNEYQKEGEIIYLNDSVIMIKNQQMKLFVKENGKITIDCTIDQQQVSNKKDNVIIKLKREDFKYLLEVIKQWKINKESIKEEEIKHIEEYGYVYLKIEFEQGFKLIMELDKIKTSGIKRINNTFKEQLYSVANETMRRVFDIRLYSEYFRLQSYIGFKGSEDIKELARLGIVNTAEMFKKLVFFNETNRKIILSTNQNIITELKQQLTETEINQFINENVPIEVTINSKPFTQIKHSIKKFSKTHDNNYLAVLDSNDNLTIFYVQHWIKQIIHVKNQKNNDDNDDDKIQNKDEDIVEDDDEYAIFGDMFGEDNLIKKQPDNLLKQLQKLPQSINKKKIKKIKNSQCSSLSEGEEEEKEEQEEEEKEEEDEEEEIEENQVIVPDKKLVEQIYIMGFPIDIAEKALIQVKNKGISEALDVVMELNLQKQKLQEEQDKIAKSLKKQKRIKANWQCEICTLINQNGKEKCDACEQPAPENAYEYVDIDQDKKVEGKNQEQEEKKKEDEQQEQQKEQQEEKQQEIEKVETIICEMLLIKLEGKENQCSDLISCYLIQEGNRKYLDLSKYGLNILKFSQLCMTKSYLKQDSSELIGEMEKELSEKMYIDKGLKEQVKELGVLFDKVEYQQINQKLKYELEYQQVFSITYFINDQGLVFILVHVLDSLQQQYLLQLHLQVFTNNIIIEKRSTYLIPNNLQPLSIHSVDQNTVLIIYQQAIITYSLQSQQILYQNQLNHSIVKVQQINSHHYLLIDEANSIQQLEIPLSQTQLLKQSQQSQQQQQQPDILTIFSNLKIKESIDYEINSNLRYNQQLNETIFYFDNKQKDENKIELINQNKRINSIIIQVNNDSNQVNYSSNNNKINNEQWKQLNDKVQQEKKIELQNKEERNYLWMNSQNVMNLNVHDYEGSQQCYQIKLARMLSYGKECFQSNYSNTYYIFESLTQKRMQIDSVTVGSLKAGSQQAYPIGEGFIFLLNDQQQLQYIINNKLHNNYMKIYESLQEYAGHFQFDENSTEITIVLRKKQSCKYIMLLPTKMRPQYNKNFLNNPLEIQLFVCYGKVIEEEDYNIQNTCDYINAYMNNPQILKHIDVYFDNQLVQNSYQLDSFSSQVHSIVMIPKTNLIDLKVQCLSHNSNSINLPSLDYLLSTILDDQLKSRFYYIQLLNLLILKGQFHNSDLSKLDLHQYLLTNILSQNHININALQFLNHFHPTHILKQIKNILNSVINNNNNQQSNYKINQKGIQFIIQIINENKQKCQKYILKKIEKLLSLINEIVSKNYHYIILKQQFKNSSLSFEKQLVCSDNIQHFVQEECKGFNYITDIQQSRIIEGLIDYDMVMEYKTDLKQIELLLDLKGVACQIKELQLSFQENKEHMKMIITINSINDEGFIKREYYRVFEETQLMLSKIAYQKNKGEVGCIYRDSPKSSYLGITNLNILNARYLQIIISAAYVPHSSMKAEILQQLIILPFIHSQQILQSQSSYVHPQINSHKCKLNSSINNQEGFVFQCSDKVENKMLFQFRLDQQTPIDLQETSIRLEVIQKEKQELLKSQQYKLETEMFQMSKSEIGQTQIDAIINITKDIEQTQLELLKISQHQNNVVVNQDNKLDLYYFLLKQFSQIIRSNSCSKLAKQMLPKIDYYSLGQEIFKKIIVNENNQIQKEMIMFLNSIIYKNVSQQEWTYFIIEILNCFLQSNQNTYYHHKIIQGLDNMYIPTLELLIYLQQKLQSDSNSIILNFTILNLLIKSIANNNNPNNNHKFTFINNLIYSHHNQHQLSNLFNNQQYYIVLQNHEDNKKSPIYQIYHAPQNHLQFDQYNQKSNNFICDLKNKKTHKLNIIYLGLQKKTDSSKRSQSLLTKGSFYAKNVQCDFKLAFEVNLLICDLKNMNSQDKNVLQNQSLELIIKLLEKSNDNLLLKQHQQEILQDQKTFMKFIIQQINSNDQQILEKVQKILELLLFNKFTNENSNQPKYLKKQLIVIINNFQILLQWILNYVVNDQKNNNLYNQLVSELSLQNWKNQIKFIFSFLISLSKDIYRNNENYQAQQQNNEKINLKPPGVIKEVTNQKYSMQIQEKVIKQQQQQQKYTQQQQIQRQQNQQKIVIQEKSQKNQQNFINKYENWMNYGLNIELIEQFIDLLKEKENGFDLSGELIIWTNVLESIGLIKIEQLLQKGVFDKLLQQYFQNKEQLKLSMLSGVLDESEKLLENESMRSELIKKLIMIILEVIRKEEEFNSNYGLIIGWTNCIIFGKQQEQVDKDKDQQQKVIELDRDSFILLLRQLSEYLWREMNIGGNEGCQMSSEKNIKKMKIVMNLLIILIQSNSSSLSINNINQDTVYNSMDWLIKWYIFNSVESSAELSPAIQLIKRISKLVFSFFKKIRKDYLLCKLALKSLMSIYQQINLSINTLLISDSLSLYVANKFTQSNTSTLMMLFNLWIYNDSLATYVAFDLDAFSYLLDSITLSSSNSNSSVVSVLNSLQQSSEKQQQQKQIENDLQLEDIKIIECANNVISLSNTVNLSNAQADWSINKKGNRCRLTYFVMEGNNYDEYVLQLNLGQLIEIRQLMIGINTVWTDYVDKVLGIPQSILLEGGNSKDEFKPLGQLQLINDEGYGTFSVKVFTINFNTFHSSSSILDTLKLLGNNQVKYLQLRFRRPIVTFIESLSTISNKVYDKIAISISFLSINGIPVSSLPSKGKQLIKEKQKQNSLAMITYLSHTDHQNTLALLANSPTVISKIKQNIQELSQMLVDNENLVSPIFLALTQNNMNVSNWLLDIFLQDDKQLAHAKMVLEIIISHKECQLDRLLKLHKYIMKSFMNFDHQQNLNLHHFINIFCQVIRIIAQQMLKDNDSRLNKLMSIDQQEIMTLLQIFNQYKYNNTPIKFAVNRLLITLLYQPHPFQQKDQQQIVMFTLQQVFKDMQNNSNFIEIFNNIIVGAYSLQDSIFEWLLDNNCEKIEFLINKLQEQFKYKDFKSLNICLQCLQSCLLDNSIIDKVAQNKWHILIYQLIQNTPELHKSQEILDLSINFIKKVVLDNEVLELQLSHQIKKDLEILAKNQDTNFITKFLLPLLTSENHIAVCLHPYDQISKKYLIEGSYSKFQKQKTEIKIESKILEEKSELMETIKQKLLEETGKDQKNKELVNTHKFELVMSQNKDSNFSKSEYQQIHQQIENNGFMMIVHLKNLTNNEEYVFGVVSLEGFLEPKSNTAMFYLSKGNNQIFDWTNQQRLVSFVNRLDSPYQSDYEEDSENYNAKQFSDYVLTIEEQDKDVPPLIGISLYFKEQPDQCNFIKYIGYESFDYQDISILSKEILILKLRDDISKNHINNHQSVMQFQNLQIDTILQKQFQLNKQFNLYRNYPVFDIPSNLKIKQLQQIIFKKIDKQLLKDLKNNKELESEMTVRQLGINKGILDLEFDLNQLEDVILHSIQINDTSSHMPQMRIFEQFEKIEGIYQIVELIVKNLTRWKNKDKAERWFVWLRELVSFSQLPNFFKLFMKNQGCFELLFEILASKPDDETNSKHWDEEESRAVKISYSILAEVFRVDKDMNVRKFAIENKFFETILDRIAIISKEKKRKLFKDIPNNQQENLINNDKIKSEAIPNEDKNQLKKKKGVGYASDNTGQNQKWDTSQYHLNKKQQSEQLVNLIKILETFLNFEQNYIIKQELIISINESALLPLLEGGFRSGSLLEIAKDLELFETFLRIVQVLSRHKQLLPCLLKLDQHYQPQQNESVFQLLSNLKDLANIYKQCLGVKDNNQEKSQESEEKDSNNLAEKIIYCYNYVEMNIALLQDEDNEKLVDEDAQIKDCLQLPLQQQYRELLKDMRFDYMEMKQQGVYKHHYASSIDDKKQQTQKKMIRLAQEIADLSISLPVEHTNSIFVRCDKQRVDVMKAMIMGAKDTPYSNGAFEFDIYFDENYPQGPPKVNLTTTGKGQVRFNPNLYSCGKVCLSLLGTWRGNASENWDPQISTLLQVLVSLQAIIMSEEVYFNEPGFEGEAGTDMGEKKNQGYSNIVKYANIKYAMIGQIKNPSPGFENVIRRHFYIKRKEIMEEVRKWQELSKKQPAVYSGLVNDHNHNWANEFKATPQTYQNMLDKIIQELETELNKLQPPTIEDNLRTSNKKKKVEKKEVKQQEQQMDLETIDVKFDNIQQEIKEIDVEADEVKDRWSRYIGAMGIEAVKKQAQASVLLIGCNSLGIEIAKNIILSGVKKFVVYDQNITTFSDLSGQFFLSEADVGHNRAAKSVPKLQELNYYVKVEHSTQQLIDLIANIKQFSIVILAMELDLQSQLNINNACRNNQVYFIMSYSQGLVNKSFIDLGDQFTIIDKDGEELQEIMIKSIDNNKHATIELSDNNKVPLNVGDLIQIDQVVGISNINKNIYKVLEQFSLNKYKIDCDTSEQGKYERNGVIKQLKAQIKLENKSLQHQYSCDLKDLKFDENMQLHDFMKLDNQLILHLIFKYILENKAQPIIEQIKFITEILKNQNKEITMKEEQLLDFIEKVNLSLNGNFGPLNAFVGGYISQEIIKAITNKYMPTNQWVYFDCLEIITDKNKLINVQLKNDRLDGLRLSVGDDLCQKIQNTKIFMVGSGAIGCELLKNYAMISLGTGKNGSITLTDPDIIEVSNLNRQFLFREKHLRKSKSQVAAASVIQMNPLLKNKVTSRLDKVCEQSEEIYDDQFYEQLDIVTNALDNIKARRYVDARCVQNRIPLIESGTLGPKGHVQVIIPFKTETYGQQQDPEEETQIPHCTLKMFPEETLHCVEWARDLFGKYFTVNPKSLQKIFEDYQQQQNLDNVDVKQLNDCLKMMRKRPQNFEDCVKISRKKFQKYFHNDIKQLMFTYPLDKITKDGKLFWSQPKRPPLEIIFNSNDELHIRFIVSFSCLLARIHSIVIPDEKNIRNKEIQIKIAEKANSIIIQEFQPSQEKANQINNQVDEGQQQQQQQQQSEQEQKEDIQKLRKQLIEEFKKFKKEDVLGKSEEFEKDNDQNQHIDFIWSMANIRSNNYKLENMDWMKVKIKAGRIIPALATTTAAIAGLQTIELVKLINQVELQHTKNAFLNLAIPYCQLSEPGPVPKNKITEKLETTIWDRWEIDLKLINQSIKSITLNHLFKSLQEKYSLQPVDVFHGTIPVYIHALYKQNEQQKTIMLSKSIFDLLELENSQAYVDLTITFIYIDEDLNTKNNHQILKGIPVVRLILKENK